MRARSSSSGEASSSAGRGASCRRGGRRAAWRPCPDSRCAALGLDLGEVGGCCAGRGCPRAGSAGATIAAALLDVPLGQHHRAPGLAAGTRLRASRWSGAPGTRGARRCRRASPRRAAGRWGSRARPSCRTPSAGTRAVIERTPRSPHTVATHGRGQGASRSGARRRWMAR